MSASTQGRGNPRWGAPEMNNPQRFGLTDRLVIWHDGTGKFWFLKYVYLASSKYTLYLIFIEYFPKELITRNDPYSELTEGAAILAIDQVGLLGRIWPNDRPTTRETLLALLKLTVTDVNSNLEVFIGEASHAT